jgi:hypothetical protein
VVLIMVLVVVIVVIVMLVVMIVCLKRHKYIIKIQKTRGKSTYKTF